MDIRTKRYKAFRHGFGAGLNHLDYPASDVNIYAEPSFWAAYHLGRQFGSAVSETQRDVHTRWILMRALFDKPQARMPENWFKRLWRLIK